MFNRTSYYGFNKCFKNYVDTNIFYIFIGGFKHLKVGIGKNKIVLQYLSLYKRL